MSVQRYIILLFPAIRQNWLLTLVVLIFTAVKKLKPCDSNPSPYNILNLFPFF